jgi:hypothetical protein
MSTQREPTPFLERNYGVSAAAVVRGAGRELDEASGLPQAAGATSKLNIIPLS